jgi:Surface-adhesin protein E
MPFTIRPRRAFLPLVYRSPVCSLITLLLLGSGPVYAEWTKVSYGQTGVIVYVDFAANRRDGNRVKMWELFDYKTIQTQTGDPFMSFERQTEYDCAKEHYRMLAVTSFSGNMATGTVVFTDSGAMNWHPVQPNSIHKTLCELACIEK